MRTGAIAVLLLMLYGCAASRTGPRTGSQVAQRVSANAPRGQQRISMNPTNNLYLAEIQKHITSKWGYPCVLDPATGTCEYKDGAVALEFSIADDGQVSSIRVVRPSGLPTYDQHAIDTVRAAAPFPPIPESSGTKPLLITLTLQYVVERKHDDRPRSQSRP